MSYCIMINSNSILLFVHASAWVIITALSTSANSDPTRSAGYAIYGYDACGNRISRMVEFDDEDLLRPDGNNQDAEQSETLGDITVYPRVTTGIVNVATTANLIDSSLAYCMTNLQGSIVDMGMLTDQISQIRINQSSGIYLLTISSTQDIKTFKIVKIE